MKRYEKFVFEAEKGVNFTTTDGLNGELIVRAFNMFLEIDSTKIVIAESYSKNYVDPPVPNGYRHVKGNWKTGFMIERKSDKSQFVWIPVGYLDLDGTLDGRNFSEKFGRRNYEREIFSEKEFNEEFNGELFDQLKSVKKYGGFYISCYDIFCDKNNKPYSLPGMNPIVDIDFFAAKKLARSLEDTETVKSHLMYGAEYDTVLAWILKSKAKTFEEVTVDSSSWGNYEFDRKSNKIVLTTASSEETCVNNIYDFAGNIEEWTQEKKGTSDRVTRGSGNFINNDNKYSVSYRNHYNPHMYYRGVGFRVSLWIA